MSRLITELVEIFWIVFSGLLTAQSLKTITVQRLQVCIFFVNERHDKLTNSKVKK